MKKLVLAKRPLTFDDCMRMYEKITGKSPSKTEVEAARRKWDAGRVAQSRKTGAQ